MSDRALILAINNYRDISDLRGCHNDAENIKRLLIEKYNFDANNIETLKDEAVTKNKVQKKFRALAEACEPGDRLVLHYSGHGSYMPSENDDEEVDEILCMYDMDWQDPSTYIIDDDMGKMLSSVPEGVNFTVILDCCHSESGTRKVPGYPDDKTPRAIKGARGTRSTGANEILARFAMPPDYIRERISDNATHRSLKRSIALNHLLLAACRDEEPAADAPIDSEYHGAFTYHLCKSAHAAQGKATARSIFDAAVKAMKSRYTQIPKINGPWQDSPLFNGGKGSASSSSGASSPDVARFLSSYPNVNRLLGSLDQFLGNACRQDLSRGYRSGNEVLVCVHGIGRHQAGYSVDWRDAIAPHLTKSLDLAEVLWSHHVNDMGRSFRSQSESREAEKLKEAIDAVIEERARQENRELREQSGDRSTARSVTRGNMPEFDDFIRYSSNEATREAILDEFFRVVEPLLAEGKTLHIISHSWGTVVAYEGLRRLEDAGLPGKVANLFVVGSALSIGPVQNNLFGRTNDGRKPEMVEKWYNLDAKGDLVGGDILPDFEVDEQFLELHPTGCPVFLGVSVNMGCSHGSYFNPDNDEVNRDIFARYIDSTRAVSRGARPRFTTPAHHDLDEDERESLRAQKERLEDELDSMGGGNGSARSTSPGRSTRTGRKFAIVVGHTRTAPGAYGVAPINASEYPWNKNLAEMIEAECQQRGIECKTFFRDSVGIAGAYRAVNNWGATAVVELHFNADGGQARGTETLYGSANSRSRAWAQQMQDKLVDVYDRQGNHDRKIKLRVGPNARGSESVNALSNIPSCLIEPFFGDNSTDARLGQTKKAELAAAVAEAFAAFTGARLVAAD